MATGTVKWYDEAKSYGHIKPDDGSEDIIFHADIVETSRFYILQAGDRVLYGTREDSTGKRCLWFSLGVI